MDSLSEDMVFYILEDFLTLKEQVLFSRTSRRYQQIVSNMFRSKGNLKLTIDHQDVDTENLVSIIRNVIT